jgi:hypothetical protein
MLRPVTPPSVSTSDRLRAAWQRRHETDYEFDVRSAFGWFAITLGGYGLFILDRLMRRSLEHNRRRAALFDAAAAFAWEQARAQGRSVELRPNFEVIADRIRVLDQQASRFRDPAWWVVLSVVTFGVAGLFAWRAIDADLVEHDAAERALEAELAFIYSRLGWRIGSPDPSPAKGQHNFFGRVAATIASFGIYSLWWMRDLMVEGNEHLERNWWFEDDLALASQSLMAA